MTDTIDLSWARDAYVSLDQIGICKICKEEKDLRAGACFSCCPKVKGRLIKEGVHQLWDKDNVDNSWLYFEAGH